MDQRPNRLTALQGAARKKLNLLLFLTFMNSISLVINIGYLLYSLTVAMKSTQHNDLIAIQEANSAYYYYIYFAINSINLIAIIFNFVGILKQNSFIFVFYIYFQSFWLILLLVFAILIIATKGKCVEVVIAAKILPLECFRASSPMIVLLVYNLCLFIPICWAYSSLVEINTYIRKEYYKLVDRSSRTNQDSKILYNEFTTNLIVQMIQIPINKDIGGSIKTIASDEI